MTSGPVVLAYHSIHPAQRGVRADDVIAPPEVLASDVRGLLRAGYSFLTAEQLVSETGGARPPDRSAVLAFDDGWRDGLTVVTPLLLRLRVRATFFVCPGLWGGHDRGIGDAGQVLSEAEARDLHAAGMELAAHSMIHPDLRQLDDASLAAELGDCRAAIESITGRRCRALAYPFGLVDARVRRWTARAGFRLAFTYRQGPWRRLAAPRLPRLA